MTVLPAEAVSLTPPRARAQRQQGGHQRPLLSKLRARTRSKPHHLLSSQTRAMRSRMGASYARCRPPRRRGRAEVSTVPLQPENGRPSYHSCGSPRARRSVCASSTTARAAGPASTSMTSRSRGSRPARQPRCRAPWPRRTPGRRPSPVRPRSPRVRSSWGFWTSSWRQADAAGLVASTQRGSLSPRFERSRAAVTDARGTPPLPVAHSRA